MKIYQYYLKKRENGFYYIGYLSSDGKKQWKTTKCSKKGDALLFLKNYSSSTQDKPSNFIQSDKLLSEVFN
jgi:hypothetical protein